jgi:hypothetical protein
MATQHSTERVHHFRNDIFECRIHNGGYVLGRIIDVKRFVSNLDDVLDDFFARCWPMVDIAKTMPHAHDLKDQKNYVGIDVNDRPELSISFWNPSLVVDKNATESKLRKTAKRFVGTAGSCKPAQEPDHE